MDQIHAFLLDYMSNNGKEKNKHLFGQDFENLISKIFKFPI